MQCIFNIAYNEPQLGDSSGLESQNFQSCTNLSDSLLLLNKFKEKVNIIGFLRIKMQKL